MSGKPDLDPLASLEFALRLNGPDEGVNAARVEAVRVYPGSRIEGANQPGHEPGVPPDQRAENLRFGRAAGLQEEGNFCTRYFWV